MTLQEFLTLSEISDYSWDYSADSDRVFPSLSTGSAPTIEETDVEKKCLIAIVNQNAEMLKFLNALQGIPVVALLQNLGGVRRAANVSALMMAEKIEGVTGADTLNIINIKGETGGAYQNVMLSASGGASTPEEPLGNEEELTAIWQVQTEWLNAEILRLTDMLGILEGSQTVDMPDGDGSRGLWSSLMASLAGLYARWALPIGQFIAVMEALEAGVTLAGYAYALYKRFWVEKETLRNLPRALISLAKMTLEVLRKLAQIPMSAANFEMRQTMALALTERFEQQLQFYLTAFNHEATSAAVTNFEQITEALEDIEDKGAEITTALATLAEKEEALKLAVESLQYNDQDIDFGGVHVAMRSKLITEP